MELRKSKRYQLSAPASFLWSGPNGHLRQGVGTIRNVSDRGVFVLGTAVPFVGAHLDIDVYLPSLVPDGCAVQLHGEGTVVRIERDALEIKGFAADVAFQTEAASGPTVVNPRSPQ